MANSRRSFSLEVYESPRAPTPYVDQSCFSSDPNTPDNTDNTDGHPPKRASRELHNLVRRASLNGAGNGAGPAMNPQDAHPDLQLSGRIISACICIRYALGFTDGSDWDLSTRRGTSALFDHFSNLSGPDSQWDHTLVAWTGEIEANEKVAAKQDSNSKSEMARAPSQFMHPGSAPVPLHAPSRAKTEQPIDGVRVSKEDRQELERRLWADTNGRAVPVWLCDEAEEGKDAMVLTDQSRWRRFAERELYTLFHYKLNEPSDGRRERKWWADYRRMNQKFADRILELYKPGDIVWVHDYHLMLLPSLLRQRMPNMYIGYFLHTPFPTSELFRCLSRRKEVLAGALGANMIGFQTYNYSRHFSSCCTRVLGFDALSSGVDAYGAHIAIDTFPIGIDAKLVEREAFAHEDIDTLVDKIKIQYQGLKVIVGRDRLDTVRGLGQKLMAFDVFLRKYPEWRAIAKAMVKAVITGKCEKLENQLTCAQVTSPTSIIEGKEDTDHKIDQKISNLVSQINGEFGGLEYTPVLHFSQHLSQSEYFALLRVADVGLITSVRDGMNTASLEYVIAQKYSHGPLILSEFSGTAASLMDATHINPWDLGGVADAVYDALVRDPSAKAAQHDMLYRHVTTNTVQTWSRAYLEQLMINLTSFTKSIATPVLDKVELLIKYRQAGKRLFMFDYDGTLTPIVKDPAAAIPSDRVIRTIKKLAQDPANNVWIISGRDQAFLDEWMGHIPELGLSAEHGSFMRPPHSEEWENLTSEIDMRWQEEVVAVFQHFTERTQGSMIERKKIAVTWHYRRADPEFGAYQARECGRTLERTVAKAWDVEVMAGKANLEVRPRFVNKGEIVKRLVAAYAGRGPHFVLCLGDDFTDEDMFRALGAARLPPDRVFACTVGASSKKTLASWHLLEPQDVIATVAMLNGRPSAIDAVALEAAEHRLSAAG